MTPFAMASALFARVVTLVAMTTSYLVVFSERYALLAKKFSRRVRKTIPKCDYQLRSDCLSVRPSMRTEQLGSREKLPSWCS